MSPEIRLYILFVITIKIEPHSVTLSEANKYCHNLNLDFNILNRGIPSDPTIFMEFEQARRPAPTSFVLRPPNEAPSK